jgi:hypothetical protein
LKEAVMKFIQVKRTWGQLIKLKLEQLPTSFSKTTPRQKVKT